MVSSICKNITVFIRDHAPTVTRGMLVRLDGKKFTCKNSVKGRSGCAKKTCKKTTSAPRPIVNKDVLYEVETVVAKKHSKSGWLYLVKWTGYDEVHNSWIDTLPPFFDKESAMYKKKNVHYESDNSYTSDDGSEYSADSVEDSSDEDEMDGSDDDDDDDDDFESSRQVGGKVKATKKPKHKYTCHDEDNNSNHEPYIPPSKRQKKTTTEKMVVKALLALSAVVAAGVIEDTESESDE